MKFFAAAAVLLTVFLLYSCKKDPDLSPPGFPPPVVPGDTELVIRFIPTVGKVPLIRDSTYQLFQGETFTASKFKYYVSNIVLNGLDGATFIENESYHLVVHFEGRESFTITGMPAGTYTSIAFLIGVDARRNTSGAQTGDLDPEEQMFWDWNTGYIFYKLEGRYHSFSDQSGDYAFHVGGFSEPENALQTVTLIPGEEMVIDGKKQVELRINVDATEVFKTPNPMSFDTYFNQISQPDIMKKLSENYRDMFSVESVVYLSK